MSPPTQSLTFQGVHIDAVTRNITLPVNKLADLKTLDKAWLNKKLCTKRDLLSLLENPQRVNHPLTDKYKLLSVKCLKCLAGVESQRYTDRNIKHIGTN